MRPLREGSVPLIVIFGPAMDRRKACDMALNDALNDKRN